jgi:hypothetical protein
MASATRSSSPLCGRHLAVVEGDMTRKVDRRQGPHDLWI